MNENLSSRFISKPKTVLTRFVIVSGVEAEKITLLMSPTTCVSSGRFQQIDGVLYIYLLLSSGHATKWGTGGQGYTVVFVLARTRD